jgi:hypothetical protein
MQRYFAAVLTSNHCDSTSDPGATSLGSMAYLQCFGRGKVGIQEFRYEATWSLPPARRKLRSSSVFSDPNDARPLGLEQLRTEHARSGVAPQSFVLASPASTPLGARALLRAGRRGDEASGEELMLTLETRGRQRLRRSGDSWRLLATTFECWQHPRRRCDTDRYRETVRITQGTE